MAGGSAGKLMTAGKVAETLGIPPGQVKKLIENLRLQPDDVQRGCKDYGPAALGKLKAELKKR